MHLGNQQLHAQLQNGYYKQGVLYVDFAALSAHLEGALIAEEW